MGVIFCGVAGLAQRNSPGAAVNTYLQPYVQSENFAGAVLVKRNGKVVFERAYGFADRERGDRNTVATRFHIASMSMQFTAAAILCLVDNGSIKLDEPVSNFVHGVEGADKIRIRDLLTERSGLPDINALPAYGDVLQHHQTPASLVSKIEGRSLLFEPGSKFLHEEHSAYNLLALIVEKKSGLPFAAAVRKLIFQPVGLTASAVDDDSRSASIPLAQGYEPAGMYGLKPAKPIHWSAKTGNASVYTTVDDEARWVDALFRGRALSGSSREAVLDTSMRAGFGWFKGENRRFGQIAYYMNGRAPGFASFVLYLPQAQTAVVVLSNIYSSAATTIGYDIAALSLGLPYERFRVQKPAPALVELETCAGTFQFGAGFYQPNAKLTLIAKGRELFVHWPSGEDSALIPIKPDHFIDRSYWADVEIKRDTTGRPATLVYDHFEGTTSPVP